MPKSEWYAAMRERFLTSLERFTDEEIEAGIVELEQEYCTQDLIEVETEFRIVILTK